MIEAIIGRVKRLIMSPKTEWEAIDGEAVEQNDLIMKYVAPLAAIPAIASIIGLSIIGVNILGNSFRIPFGSAVMGAIVSFIFAIIGVFVFAFIINALAPSFGAEKNFKQALKVSAYAPTASWIAGVFTAIPALSVLGLIGAVYSLYLLFVGLPKIMKPPSDKATTYTIVSLVVAIIVGIVLSGIAGVFTPKPGIGSMTGAHGGAMRSEMDERLARLEEASESGNINDVVGALGGMVGGDSDGAVVEIDALRELAPARLAGLKRQSVNVESLSMPFTTVVMTAEYGAGDKSLELTVTNSPMISAVMGVAGFSGAEYDRRSDDGYERLKRSGDTIIMSEWSKSSKRGRYARLIAGSFLVEAKGRNLNMKEIERAAKEINEKELKKLPKQN